MKSYIILISLFIVSTVINGQNKIALGNFDISPDDKQIIFSYRINDISAIYTINTDGTNLKKIIESDGTYFYISPKYSLDGSRFIYLRYGKDSNNGSIILANINGKDDVQLTNGDHIITEAIFSKGGDSIYFIRANEYDSYSPIGVKAPHDMDIYCMSLKDKKTVKVSNLKSYEISSISDYDNKYILLRFEGYKNGGLYFLDKKDGKLKDRIVPANNPRKLAEVYYIPNYSEKYNTMVFIAPYEIFEMNMTDKIAKSVFFNKGRHTINNLSIFKNSKEILFTTNDDRNLHIINYDGSNLREIKIVIN